MYNLSARVNVFIVALLLTFAGFPLLAQDHHHQYESSGENREGCGDMEVMDYSMGMCMPLPMPGMPMKMLMVEGNSFFTQVVEEGPRGKNAFVVPNFVMADLGSSWKENHYVNLNFMGTLERWTFPKDGYPELLQVGETNENDLPYLDSQHPHSSPIMGLTLSDTWSHGRGKDHSRFWFAPRGASGDGPVPFMHRKTGKVNPDAPLGHHIGQDSGHITSTVVGVSHRRGSSTIEVSGFHGEEPEPTKVDLPLGEVNSFAARWTQQWSEHVYTMASVARVKEPEHHGPDLDHIWRYSASLYRDNLYNGWNIHRALIWGLINGYDHSSKLNSVTQEFWLQREKHNIWNRVEVLERTAAQLQVPAAPDVMNDPKFIWAFTIGYTYRLLKSEDGELGLGFSVTKDFLPEIFQDAYSGNPMSGKIFLRLSGEKMWDL